MRVWLPRTADFGFCEERVSKCIQKLFQCLPETPASTFHLLNQGKLLAIAKG